MLYSINYNHWGERKIWYGVPGEEAELFDKVVKESAPELFMENKDLLHQMITHINPQFLIDRGLHVYTVHQNAGEFVITFPRSYHAGFNEGLNCAEAVNFAPPDWLKMGRLCLENYANVGRTCVFSHEELVMKMVTVAHKLSIAMCMATLDELSWIVARETDFRHRLSIAGVCATAFCRFEDIPDDERSCAVCRTTLFCSGLCCRHDGRMVCAKHVQQLCTECSMEQYCLKFRYTLDDLVPLVHRLTERTTAFFEWRTTVAQLLNGTTKTAPTTETDNNSSSNNDGTIMNDDDDGKLAKMDAETNGGERAGNVGDNNNRQRKKIDVLQMRALADQWRTARFPHCEQIQRINQAIVQFERTANAVRKMLNRKIRLRDQTRCQKADTRWEYAEMLSLRQQLADSLLEDRELEDGIQDLCHRVERWKSRANAALERSFAAAAAQQTVNELYALVTEAREEFNVKLEAEGLDRLKSELARCQWLVNAQTIWREIERWHHNIAEKGIGTEEEEGKEEQKQKQSVDEQKQHNETEEEEMDAKRGTKTTEDNKNVEGIVEEQSSPIDEGMAPEEEQEEAEGEGEQKRVELHELAKTVADGLKWCTNCTAVQQLNAKLEHFLNHGNALDQRAADFLAFARNQQQKQQKALPTTTTAPSSSLAGGGCVANTAPTGAVVAVVGVELARQKWAEIAAAMTATAQNNNNNNCDGNDAGNGGPPSSSPASSLGIDWIQSPAIDSFRAELQLAQNAYDDFDQLYKKAFSLRTLEQLEHNFAQSLFERDGQRHAKLKGWLDGLQRFVARIRTIFQKTVSYYTLFDIVAGRSDLPALIEGESMPLALFTSAKYSDNWRPMRAFESRDQLVAHLQSVGDQQCTLLHALRVTNAGRSPKETCSCARDAPPSASTPRRRGAQRLTPQSSASGSKATAGSRQRKRASLPSRTATAGRAGRGAAAATSSAFDTSPPTMVVAERTAATPTTSLATSCTSTSSSAAEQQQQQQQQQGMDTDGQQQQHNNNNNNNSLQSESAVHVAVEQQQQQRIAPNELIPCFVCNANLHVVCVQWDPFFARLPPGVLLCQRCLRSRRPCIEDVEAACRNSELPENCLERIVVQNLSNRSVNIFTRLQRLLHTIPTGTKQIEQNVETALKKWLTMALSLEITDIEVYNVLANSAYFDLFPLPARQIQIWHHVRERMVDAQPLQIIFGHSISGPSASGGTNSCGSVGRRVSNAGGKRRSGGNNNGTNNGTNHQHLRHSLSAMLNISSSSVSSVDSSSSLLLFPPLSASSHSVSGSSPAKQQRRHHQQQPASSSTANCCANADDGIGDDKMGDHQNGNELLAMMDGQQQHQTNHVDGKGTMKREQDEQMEQEEEEDSSNDQQHEHDDDGGGAHMEKCAADFCLRPYSEFTRWIQCEAGCARWYHFCCVGISVRGVQQISAYCCYKCAAASAAAAAAIEANTTTSSSDEGGTLAKVATIADDSGGQQTVPVVAADNDDDEIKMEQQQPQHSPPPPPAHHRSPTATATVYN
ncbi:hypothetical protein niasHS_001680 [Heterodera schachtii]|uniref:JmjC domain-containing protein n=1 Tax=Heterodera schachtii TaxID=97005 RepID=A0ABD2KC23_HETSC